MTDPGVLNRFWARTLDTVLFSSVIMIIFIVFPPYSSINSISLRILLLYFTLIIFKLALEVFSFTLFRTTLGKHLLGISLAKNDDSVLTLGLYAKRALFVLVKGLAFGIPIANIFTALSAKARLKEKGITEWDQNLDLKVIIAPITKSIATNFALILLISLIIGGVSFQVFIQKIILSNSYINSKASPSLLDKTFTQNSTARKRALDSHPIKNIFGEEWIFYSTSELNTAHENRSCSGPKCTGEIYLGKKIVDDAYGNKVVSTLIVNPKSTANYFASRKRVAVNCKTLESSNIDFCLDKSSKRCATVDKYYLKMKKNVNYLEVNYACGSS